ncbi:uncharacterized protein KIAA0513 isoform X2 [Zootermopsis nevadensis]|uniref:uncharacterized protein KIAA0513 isoform X2 n=1 Tax=Zootermopsis nevadensis TaxID=136037 RepID=UPI000B8E685F|nr:uncharacterized protein KIAA0513 isoform X2 [Zootermopsis nevadensis]XP_021921962.1 uncharacterized protein KIAA0513 isoform X2 [Zootermopsis nevadensis]XP_021921964.1 uncharacterized protein KIAA0513 isoform X2 [Zootermopsis nevadensis]
MEAPAAMVDFLNSAPKDGNDGHLRHIMGKTQGILRSRFLSVIEGSNDLITGLSSKLESALSLSTDSASQDSAVPTSNVELDHCSQAAPEVFTRKLWFPQFGSGLSFEDYTAIARHKKEKELSKEDIFGSRNGGNGLKVDDAKPREDHSCASSESNNDISSKFNQTVELRATGPDPYDKLRYKSEAPSSGSASDGDGYGPSTSLDLSDHDGKKYWVRSGSEGSVQSWASSLSFDSLSDEMTAEAVEFMRKFVGDMFKDSSAIPLDQKSKFGQLVQHEAGRLWFARFVNAQRVQNKKVDESTFYSLVQYFAIVLFECADADDFSPAKSLMNMCFTFYHEVDVPGCEPYKEYLYTYLKDQTIWQSLRFWNAAFFDALQCERVHRPVVTREDIQHNSLEAITDEKQYQENITFGQLGTFTCNMHAFGLSKELCAEFLRKQCVIASLREDQEKMLKDNIERMYRETDPWR